LERRSLEAAGGAMMLWLTRSRLLVVTGET
jgi:hypothetical protein